MSNPEAPRTTEANVEMILNQCAQLMEMRPAIEHLMCYGTEEEKAKFVGAIESFATLIASYERSAAFEYGID